MIKALSVNATTAIVVVAGLLYLGYVFWVDPEHAAAQTPLVVSAVLALARLLYQSDVAASKADDAASQADVAARRAIVAAQQSTQNSATLETVAAKLEENTQITSTTHLAVNSRMDELIKRVEAQGKIQAELQSLIARREGVVEGRQQVADEGGGGDAVHS